jgi:hypothetical protein
MVSERIKLQQPKIVTVSRYGRLRRYIGITEQPYVGDVQNRIYLHIGNFQANLSLYGGPGLRSAAELITRFHFEHDADVVIGPAIDRTRSNAGRGSIVTLKDKSSYGLYMTSDRIPRVGKPLRRIDYYNPEVSEYVESVRTAMQFRYFSSQVEI